MGENVLLNYRELGAGASLIINHGLLGSGDNWTSIARGLSDRMKIILPDLRNHGKSFHTDEFDYHLMSQDILKLMDDLNIEKTAILGHSMGGKLAMHFALQNSERCSGLIIVDSTSRKFRGGHESIFQNMKNANLRSFSSRSSIDAYFKELYPNDGFRWFLLKNTLLKEGKYHWKPNLNSLSENYHKIVEELNYDGTYSGPTLIVSGGDSDYVKQEDLEQMLLYFPEAKHETILNAGHWVHAQKPEEMKALISSFMNELKA